DPSSPNDTGFFGKTGADAMSARPVVQKQMEDLLSQVKGTLPNTRSQVEFEQASRRLQAITFEQMGRHYEQAAKTWGVSVMSGGMATNERSIANNYNSDPLFQNYLEDQKGLAVKGAQLNGQDPVTASNEATSRAYIARINGALARRDYASADRYFKEGAPFIDDKVRPQIERTIHGGLDDSIAQSAVTRAQTGAPAPSTTPQTPLIPKGWEPGDYPNAPVESAQPISHPERNNPGNLRAADNAWVGKTTEPGSSFESFDTVDHGIRARAVTYGTYLNSGTNTIAQIANRSGPASDNNDIPSQIAAYKQALGGQYAQPGGENLPISSTPENIRRLTAGGISIEAGGGGKWLPKGVGMPEIDRVLQGMGDEPQTHLASYATGNAVPGGLSSVSGVNPEFGRRIETMVQAMPPDIRGKFQIVSGYRSQDRQAQVNPAVTNSHHTQGMAVDTSEDPEVLAWVKANGPKYGVGYPLADDPNHLEPLENGQRIAPDQM